MKKQMLSLGLILLLFILPINAADQTAITKFDPMGDDSYKLIFENKQGLIYNFPFIWIIEINFWMLV